MGIAATSMLLVGVPGSIGLGSPDEDVFAAIETPDDYDVKQA
jgi:hypothetical protein